MLQNIYKLICKTVSVLALLGFLGLLNPTLVSAARSSDAGGGTATDSCKEDFLGLRPWYDFLKLGPYPNCDIKHFKILPSKDEATGKEDAGDVPLVLLAIADDMLRIAGIIAIGFVIVGAFGFVTSQGNPEGAAKAQSTVINALIGLVVSIVAVAFISFLGNQLGD